MCVSNGGTRDVGGGGVERPGGERSEGLPRAKRKAEGVV